jgi:glutamate--cysteine ligase
LSTPGCWNGRVQPATFGGAAEQEDARRYRDYLADKYGAARQAISGVHFNVSFPEVYWAALADKSGAVPDRTAHYFAVMRNLLRYRFVLTYLLGASPLVDARWGDELVERLTVPARSLFAVCGPHSSSLRSGPLGYQLSDYTAEALTDVWSGLPAYVGGIREAIANGDLASEREFYAPVRPKTGEGGGLQALERRGVEYLEIRVLDLDPLANTGVTQTTLLFVEAFIAAAALLPDQPLTAAELATETNLNTWATMCSCPRSEELRAILSAEAAPLWPALREAAELVGPEHAAATEAFAEIFAGRKPRIVDQLFAGAEKSGLSLRNFGLRLARQYREELAHD